MSELDAFTGTLPYASELFGIYQPLLGWKSKILRKRYDRHRLALYDAVADKVLNAVHSQIKVQFDGERGHLPGGRWMAAAFQVDDLKPVTFFEGIQPAIAPSIDSAVARLVQAEVGDTPPGDWGPLMHPDLMTARLDRVQAVLRNPDDLAREPALREYVDLFTSAFRNQDVATVVHALFDKEARIAGYLSFLGKHSPDVLSNLFFKEPQADAFHYVSVADPLLSFGTDNYDAVLSPIGIIHLYREYFFEFDSFLGPPVGHVWLSAGGTVELIEVNTRKTFTERTFEMSTETIQKSEKQLMTQDEIADAVKDDNKSDVKFGATNTAKYDAAVFQDTATVNFSLDNAKSTSRETTHKHMRQQTEKLSSEIKRNFKTTFRTSTETTDTTSKRYVIENKSDRLVNYELRRKMRKVGVQVQDIGVQLCWHTFVDDPARALGVGELVHIGEPPELADLVHPDQPVMPAAQNEELTVEIPFVGLDTDDTDNAYTDGRETEVGFLDSTEHIEPNFPRKVTFANPGYTLMAVTIDPQGSDAKVSARDLASAEGSSAGSFTAHLDYVNWHGRDQITVKATLTWAPTQTSIDAVKTAYQAKLGEYTAEKARRFKEAFLKASRDRIKLASMIQARPADALREEERTVVYRRLVSQLMSVGPNQSKHVVSELIRSIFDVDRMLYFVAPEWWIPRLHRSAQHLGSEQPATGGGAAGGGGGGAAQDVKVMGHLKDSAVKMAGLISSATPIDVVAATDPSGPAPEGTPIPSQDIVDWGGAREKGRDNYYITEESAPAKLGSSLGWMLQLDGDDLRNAMLNSPWVKAVIPIRIGKEQAAINWLSQAHVEGSDGLQAKYQAEPTDPPELQSTPDHTVTITDALEYLIGRIGEYDRRSRKTVEPNPAEPDDPSNHFVGSLPTEAVFEHGFYPLKGGTRFNQSGVDQVIFSQWMEILPTDQVAAVEVEYDPKTLQVKVTPQPPRDDHAVPPPPPPP
jgi:hypothetical protein